VLPSRIVEGKELNMKKLVTVLLALAMAFTMVFATAASAEDGYKDSIT
jgi:hypothetical protein